MENKNGQGIFYGVIGVATLVVAIIGATFAYFSASRLVVVLLMVVLWILALRH